MLHLYFSISKTHLMIGMVMSPIRPKPKLVYLLQPIWKCCGNWLEIKPRKMNAVRAADSPRYFVWLLTRRELGARAGQSWTSAWKSKVGGHLNQGYWANAVHPRIWFRHSDTTLLRSRPKITCSQKNGFRNSKKSNVRSSCVIQQSLQRRFQGRSCLRVRESWYTTMTIFVFSCSNNYSNYCVDSIPPVPLDLVSPAMDFLGFSCRSPTLTSSSSELPMS